MHKDEIVKETRRWRDEYARKFNYDLDLMFADLKRKEAQSGREYTSLADDKMKKSKSTGTKKAA